MFNILSVYASLVSYYLAVDGAVDDEDDDGDYYYYYILIIIIIVVVSCYGSYGNTGNLHMLDSFFPFLL